MGWYPDRMTAVPDQPSSSAPDSDLIAPSARASSQRFDMCSALMRAIWDNDEAAFVQALANGADPNTLMPSSLPIPATNPLRAAVALERWEMAAALVRAGAHPNDTSFQGQTMLMAALWAVIRPADLGTHVERLLALGCAPSTCDEDGDTALHGAHFNPDETPSSAERAQMRRVIALLVAAGADINAANGEGFTPLHYAAMRNDAPTCGALLDRGANPWATADLHAEAVTPEEFARRHAAHHAAGAIAAWRD